MEKLNLKQRKRKTKKNLQDNYHHGELKRELIRTALDILKKHAPSELSLRELARRAGVSQAAPYRHFKDKNELIAAIMQEGFEIKYSYMQEAIEKNKKTPEKMFLDCAVAYFKMGLLHPQHFKLMVSADITPSPEYPELLQSASKTFSLLVEMIKISQDANVIGKGDPIHKAMNCWCVVNGFTALYAEGRLDWLGVNAKNAEAAIRTLVLQYLIGNKESLDKCDFGFKPFQTKESQDWQKLFSLTSQS